MAQLGAIYGFKGLRIHLWSKKRVLFLSGYFFCVDTFFGYRPRGDFFSVLNVIRMSLTQMSSVCLLYVFSMSDEKQLNTRSMMKQLKSLISYHNNTIYLPPIINNSNRKQ